MSFAKHALMWLALACACAPAAQADKLVILHTNDTHSQIDPASDDGLGGVARRKVVIDSVRAANDNVLLIDAGDVVQGSLFFNLYKGELEERLLNLLGYDMRILGNHEFDNAMEALARNLSVSEAELLCSNYVTEGTPLQGLFKPYSIREIGGKRIAFLPLNLQPKGMIPPRNVEGMGYIDDVETAEHLAWYLKKIEHADMVIAISHIGYYPDRKLIGQTRCIDAIIGGHSHTLVNPADPESPSHIVENADGRQVLIAQTGRGGKYVGQITIDLDSLDALPKYELIRIDSRLDHRVDPAVEEIIHPYRASVDALYAKKVAKAPKRMEKDSDMLLNLMADFVDMRGRQLAGDIDLAIINKGGIRNPIAKGDVTEGDIITLMPFFNRIQVIEVTGENLARAFDTMARANGNGVSANVVAIYDPDADVCTEVLISGKPIDPSATYRVATIDYLANGGDYFESLVGSPLVAESPRYLFEDMLEYYRTGKVKKMEASEKPRMKTHN